MGDGESYEYFLCGCNLKEFYKLVAIPDVISVGLSLITRVSMMVINLFGLPLYIMHKPADGLKEIENIIEKGGN